MGRVASYGPAPALLPYRSGASAKLDGDGCRPQSSTGKIEAERLGRASGSDGRGGVRARDGGDGLACAKEATWVRDGGGGLVGAAECERTAGRRRRASATEDGGGGGGT